MSVSCSSKILLHYFMCFFNFFIAHICIFQVGADLPSIPKFGKWHQNNNFTEIFNKTDGHGDKNHSNSNHCEIQRIPDDSTSEDNGRLNLNPYDPPNNTERKYPNVSSHS